MSRIKHSQTKLSHIDVENFIDGIPGSVYWKNVKGVYLGCNKAVLLKGAMQSRAEIVGKTDFDIWPEMAESLRKVDLEVMQQNKTIEIEEQVVLKNGEIMHFSSVKKPLLDENGNIIGVLGNSLDITELKVAKQNAEVANQEKTQFLALMSHELRTPLTGIISTASILAEAEEMKLSEKEVANFARIIERSGAYLLSTIDNILDFAKLEANKFDLIAAPYSFSKIVQDILSMMIASAQKKNISMSVEYIGQQPPMIMSDSRVMRHILINLIGNAIKYTDEGTIKILVRTLKQSATSVVLQIEIRDTGIGIGQDKLDFIFHKFTQAQTGYTHKTSRLGTGLGLSIVKKLIDLLHGKIWVKSKVGKGSVFCFRFKAPLPSQ